MALCTAGPDGERSSKLLNASATAPASAPASADVCACVRAVMNIPTSIASVVAASKAARPALTTMIEMPRSSFRMCRRRFLVAVSFMPALLRFITHLRRRGERHWGAAKRRAINDEVHHWVQHDERERVIHIDPRCCSGRGANRYRVVLVHGDRRAGVIGELAVAEVRRHALLHVGPRRVWQDGAARALARRARRNL